eukprot:m.79941 g.79941  ORF g.79941 m.79941 type:complete len:288 (-) comp8019_c0_seq1:442-1305(-)
MLRNIVHTTTRQRLRAATGIVLDGPMGPEKGQGTPHILYALQGSAVRLAKVGPPSLRHEFEVSSAILQRSTCRSILPIQEPIELPSASPSLKSKVVLLMPSHPMSVADALLALPPDACVERDVFAYNVAISGLAGIYSFGFASFAHGDIKPGNIMLVVAESQLPPVLIDFGTARPIGQPFTESSIFNLNQEWIATTDDDLVCLGATIAAIQYGPAATPGEHSTRTSFLAQLAMIAPEGETPASGTGTGPDGSPAVSRKAPSLSPPCRHNADRRAAPTCPSHRRAHRR